MRLYYDISISSLCNKEPNLFPPTIGFSLRPMAIRCVQCCLPSLNICFFRFDPPRALKDLPEQVQRAIHRYAHIFGDDVVAIEFLCLAGERVEAIEQNNHGEEAEGERGGVGLVARLEDERVAADALSAQSAIKLNIRNRDGHPGQHCGDCCKILEPLEDDLGTSGARHVGEQGDGGSKADAPVWNAPGLQMLAKLAIIQEVRKCDLSLGACQ